MSSNNPYNSGVFKRGDNLTAKHLETLRAGTTGNVQSRNVDNFVRRLPSGHILTSKRKSKPAASGIFLLIITASTDKNTYTANVIDNRTDKTVLKTAVTLKALDHTDGTFPNSIILTCSYDSTNEFYEPTNYAVFYGS